MLAAGGGTRIHVLCWTAARPPRLNRNALGGGKGGRNVREAVWNHSACGRASGSGRCGGSPHSGRLPRTSNTSPLAALFALVWSCTYLVTGLLTWRRSRIAAPGFLVAMGLLLPPFSLIFPGGEVLLLPSSAVTFFFGFLGYRYLIRALSPPPD